MSQISTHTPNDELLDALKVFLAQYENEATPNEARRYVNIAYLRGRLAVARHQSQDA